MKKISIIILVVIMMVSISTITLGAASESNDLTILQVNLLNQNPDPVSVGDTFELRLKAENTGGFPIEFFTVKVVENYPFTVVDGEPIKNYGTLERFQNGNNYQNIVFTIKVDKDAMKGKQDLTLMYSFDENTWVTEKFNINIVNKAYAQIIYIDKSKLDPGKETDMKFTITNVGNSPLKNLVFSWTEGTAVILPVYSDDTQYINYLDVNQSVNLMYKVIANVNAVPGLYALDLSLTYESLNNNTVSKINTKTGVFVGGGTDFDISFSESSAGQTSISVANTGNNPAQSVAVRIPIQNFFRVTGTNSAIVGNLDKGDYTLVSFQIQALNSSSQTQNSSRQNQNPVFNPNGVQEGQVRQRDFNNTDRQSRMNNSSNNPNNLVVQIDYTDTTGARISVQKNVPIQFRGGVSGVGNGYGGTGGRGAQSQSTFIGSVTFWIILVIILVICFWILKNKDKRDKIFELIKYLFSNKEIKNR